MRELIRKDQDRLQLRGAQRLSDRDQHRVELVVASHLLGHATAVVLNAASEPGVGKVLMRGSLGIFGRPCDTIEQLDEVSFRLELQAQFGQVVAEIP